MRHRTGIPPSWPAIAPEAQCGVRQAQGEGGRRAGMALRLMQRLLRPQRWRPVERGAEWGGWADGMPCTHLGRQRQAKRGAPARLSLVEAKMMGNQFRAQTMPREEEEVVEIVMSEDEVGSGFVPSCTRARRASATDTWARINAPPPHTRASPCPPACRHFSRRGGRPRTPGANQFGAHHPLGAPRMPSPPAPLCTQRTSFVAGGGGATARRRGREGAGLAGDGRAPTCCLLPAAPRSCGRARGEGAARLTPRRRRRRMRMTLSTR